MKRQYTEAALNSISGRHDELMRRSMLIAFILFYSMLVPVNAQAEKALNGSVMDAGTKEALPVAHIRIEGMRAGTITNSEGAYSLNLTTLPASLAVSYIGYHTKKVIVTQDTPENIDIYLEPNPVIMQAVIVTPGNSAERIMRRVIAKKQEWRERLDTFKADAYTRVNVAGNEKIAIISESISELYWDREQGTKEIIKSKRNTKNLKQNDNVAHARWTPNLYDDDIEMFGFTMLGVTHPDALSYYKFELIDQKLMDDRTVHIITVEPKGKLQPLFRGQIRVLDEEFAVLDFDLVPNEAVMFPPPLSGFSFAVKQQFSSFGEDVWLPIDVRVEGTIKIKLSFLLEFPAMNYKQVSRLSDYQINTTLPDSLFKKNDVMTQVTISNESVSVSSAEVDENRQPIPETGDDSDLTKSVREQKKRDEKLARDDSILNIGIESPEKPIDASSDHTVELNVSTADSLALAQALAAKEDSLFAAQRRAIPFTAAEEAAYTSIDSTDTMDEIFMPTGVLSKLVKKEMKDTKKKKREQTKFGKNFSNTTKGMRPYYIHNRVDGHSGGLSYRRTFKKRFEVRGHAARSSSLERMSWSTRSEVFFREHNSRSIYFNVADQTEARGVSENIPMIFNFVSTLSGGQDYFDYYRAKKARVGVRYRPFPTTEYSLSVKGERHNSLAATAFKTLAGDEGTMRINPAVDDGDLLSFEIFYRKGGEHHPFGITGIKGVEATFEQGWHDMPGDKTTFTQIRTGANWQFKTFLKRRLFPMTLDIRFSGSASLGDLPLQRFGMIDTRFMAWTPHGAFKSLGGRPLEGEHHASLFLDHNFRTVPFELLGLRRLVKKNYGIVAHCAAGRTWIGENRLKNLAFTPEYLDHFVSEGGLSLNGVFGIGRIDFTKRFDSGDYSIGFNLARLF